MENTAERPKARIRVCIEKKDTKINDWTIYDISPYDIISYTGAATDVGVVMGNWITNILDCYPNDKLIIDITRN